MVHRTLDIDQECEALRQFFQRLGNEAVIVQLHGRPVGIVYPTGPGYMKPRGRLQDAIGGWDNVPDDVSRAIEEGTP